MIYFKNTGRYSHILFLLSLYVVFLGLVHCPSTLCSEGGITGVTWVVESVGKVSCFNMVSAVGPRCMRKQGAQGAIKSLISRVSTYILKKLFRVQTFVSIHSNHARVVGPLFSFILTVVLITFLPILNKCFFVGAVQVGLLVIQAIV